MRDMLVGAGNFQHDAGPSYDCHRHDHEAATVMTSLLALGWYMGDDALVNGLASLLGYTAREWSRPRQIKAQIYGVSEPPRTRIQQTTFYDKYNPIAVLGELTNRRRNGSYQPFCYRPAALRR